MTTDCTTDWACGRQLKATGSHMPHCPRWVNPMGWTADEWRAEVARLRALIKAAEWEGQQGRDADDACPWCGIRRETGGTEPNSTHANDCPAFTPEGEVR